MNPFAGHLFVCFFFGTYLMGVAFTLIVCEFYDRECRRRARKSGLSIEHMSFSMKLRFSLLWPYYLFVN